MGPRTMYWGLNGKLHFLYAFFSWGRLGGAGLLRISVYAGAIRRVEMTGLRQLIRGVLT